MMGLTSQNWARGLFCLVGIISAGCEGMSPDQCGNQMTIEFYGVGGDQGCAECESVAVQSDFIEANRVWIAKSPLFEIQRCGISQIFTYSDAVMLLLEPGEYARISDSEGVEQLAPSALLVARVAGNEAGASLLRAANLGRAVPLLDLDTTEEVDRFIEAVGADDSAMTRHAAKVRDFTSDESGSPATSPLPSLRSEALVERSARQRPLLDELTRLAREGGTETPEYEAILKKLESSD